MNDQRSIVDADPLGAIRDELVVAAVRMRQSRRRRRRGLTMTVAIAGLLVSAGGALAITNVGTGVPAIDRFLDTASRQMTAPSPLQPHTPLPPGATAPPRPVIDPRAGSASAPVELRLADGGRVVGVGYENIDGDLCLALAGTRSPAEDSLDGGAGCLAMSILASTLQAQAARLQGLGGLRTSIVVQGFARADVQRLWVVGAHGRAPASLSGSWTPPSWKGGPLRAFFAILDIDPRQVLRPDATMRLEAELSDGRTVRVDP